jgi:hypothetical protein
MVHSIKCSVSRFLKLFPFTQCFLKRVKKHLATQEKNRSSWHEYFKEPELDIHGWARGINIETWDKLK